MTREAILDDEQVSISPPFDEQFFYTKVLQEAFSYLHSRFNFFWNKKTGANALIKFW
jgi:hypothetical protein